MKINSKEYSTRVYVTLNNRHLYFIDEESLHNKEIRSKVYYLPENLKFLELASNKVSNIKKDPNYEYEQKHVRTWIKKVLDFEIKSN